MRKKDWTGIHFLEKTSYYDGKNSLPGALLWLMMAMASFILILLSSFAIIFRGLSMDFNCLKILGIIVPLAVVFWLLSTRWQFFWGGVGVACIGGVLFAWLNFSALSQGFISIYERGYMLVTDYMAGNVDQGVWEGELAFLVYGFVAALFCLYGAICYFGLKSAFPVLVPGIAGIVGVFFVGKVPDAFWLAVFCISSCVFVIGSYAGTRFGKYGTLTALGKHFYIRGENRTVKKIGAKAGIFMAVLLAVSAGLAFFAGNVMGLPSKETLVHYQQQIRDWSKENLHLFEGWGEEDTLPKGGISGGDLASAGDMYYYGDEQIRVTVGARPESNLYIKAYVGDRYENNRWNVEEGGDYSQFLETAGQSGEAQLLSLPYELLSQFGQDHMSIEKLAVFGSYEFFPYGARLEGGNWMNDLYIPGTSSSSAFDFTPIIYPLTGDYDDLSVYSAQFLSGNLTLSGLEGAYRNFVYDHYRQVPNETKAMLDTLTGGTVPETLKEKVVYVRRLLTDTCTYSLTPGSLPSDQDFTEYFLMENKRGYCMHFATAATLLLRNMGVPARYVEGYIMAPGNFSPSASGYEGIAYDHQAHAWTEIYLDGVGWLPVEVTPAYYDTASLTGDMDETSETMDTQEESESGSSPAESESQSVPPQSESQSEPDGSEAHGQNAQTDKLPEMDEGFGGDFSGGNSAGKGSGAKGQPAAMAILQRILLGIAAAAAILALAAAAAVLRASALNKKRVRAMRQPNRSKAVVAIYYYLLRLFEICGYKKPKDGNLHSYFEAIAKDYDFIDAAACDMLVSLANEAAFSREGVSAEQWQSCWHMYQHIRGGLYKENKLLKQIIMKYFYGC